jgi:hypothetical protein
MVVGKHLKWGEERYIGYRLSGLSGIAQVKSNREWFKLSVFTDNPR